MVKNETENAAAAREMEMVKAHAIIEEFAAEYFVRKAEKVLGRSRFIRLPLDRKLAAVRDIRRRDV